MKFDAIIFDKDGTLLDFNAFWVPVTEQALRQTVKALGAADASILKLMEVLGVHAGITDIDGVLCYGTYAQIGQALHQGLAEQGFSFDCCLVQKLVSEAYVQAVPVGRIAPTCHDLPQVLNALKEKGIKLFVVTTDNAPVTEECLDKLGIAQYFTAVYTDDGVNPPKPDPYCANDISARYGIPRERILMVGDTKNDAIFAKNAGIQAVGVAANDRNAQRLSAYMAAVVPDVSHIGGLVD